VVLSSTPIVRTLSDIKESSNELLDERRRNEYRALIEKKQDKYGKPAGNEACYVARVAHPTISLNPTASATSKSTKEMLGLSIWSILHLDSIQLPIVELREL
jgi:hypothetical protein